ncbi:MAG: SNF2-related protein [Oscillospiraceae bacterium]|nr:SNF2-related protein [Oscillospiraceae bacterium]
MARLEDITVGCSLTGIDGSAAVEILAVKWYGTAAMEITYKNAAGQLGNQILYRDSEATLEVKGDALPWSFTADSDQMRLASEAYRIHLAHLFDPYLAVHTSAIEPLPHQISAVYEAMLPRQPLRFVLADDPGAGKTIMTGLLLKELIIRSDVKRCMIVCPGNLAEQWQDELYQKFHLRFEILTNDRIESAVSGNVFNEVNFCIARLDKLARNELVQEKLRMTDWDLIVCDEAHKMSATIWGGEVKYTKRFQLGRLLSNTTRHFLLLTATPHNGKEEDFQLFMSLVDPDRFEGVGKATSNHSVDVSDVMRRLVKEELLRFDGTPLFPERIAYTVNYDLSPRETVLYQAVTDYVQEEFNRADKLSSERKTTVGFALTVLQRRLASSPEAIYQSLRRRRERLERRLEEEKLGHRAAAYAEAGFSTADLDADDWDDMPAEELERAEDVISDQASAARTIEELEAEIRTLKNLERMANAVRTSGEDRKWDELSKLLQDNENMYGQGGQREKLIIFTEHRDTLNYLTGKITSLLGDPACVVTIHGGMLRDDRRKAEALFKQDVGVRVMIATDAAGEGINLQRAHLMINYDLPWNPNRLEQRFGRIHRIGQTEVCYLWNLVANQTREGQVFQRLFSKLEQERQSLGGKVFDILGKVSFDNKPLRELLIEAIRYGNDPEVRAKLNRVVDNSLDREALSKLLDEWALTEDTMDIHKVMAIREDMERADAHKLQPHFVESFFLAAFEQLGGKIRRRETGRYEITHVPFSVRNRDAVIGYGEPVMQRYERVCFDKQFQNIPGLATASLICPGHPLLEAVIDLVREQSMDTMKQGCIFIDDNDFGTQPRMLFYIESSIQDGVILPSGGRRVISQELQFVELDESGHVRNAGYAPYLDYRAPDESEHQVIMEYLSSQQWLTHDVESLASGYAIGEIVPRHFLAVKDRRLKATEKTQKAVKERLTAAIQYWDYRAGELKQKEAAGKTNARLNSQNAARRAEELEARMQKRLAELEKEKQISAAPPVIVGGALVVPLGLLCRLQGKPIPQLFSQGDRKSIEMAGMWAVEQIERQLGYIPRDVSRDNCGYDIESQIPNTHELRFIEVKGRAAGAETVTVTKNEILVARNTEESGGQYILALVEVDGKKTTTTYLAHPIHEEPEWIVRSINYDIRNLFQNGEILLVQTMEMNEE